jgi:1-acyl-sn-glycerol-3-phosphate acyltransferase
VRGVVVRFDGGWARWDRRGVAKGDDIDARIARLEIPFGRYGVDPYGISKKYLRVGMRILQPFYQSYFSVETSGLEHVPERGRAMLVGNHSGGVALDGAMVLAAMFFSKDPPRLAQGMVEKFINRVPFASQWASRMGQFPGLPEHSIRLLEDDRLLMVFPEGARGTAKLYKDRYSLVGFGSGFLRQALQTKTPIVPFGFLGGGEAVPTISNSYALGKIFGVPYVPITPYGLAIPLPAHMQIHVGAPMTLEGTGREEDGVILGWVDEVKARVASLIATGLRQRRHLLPAKSA